MTHYNEVRISLESTDDPKRFASFLRGMPHVLRAWADGLNLQMNPVICAVMPSDKWPEGFKENYDRLQMYLILFRNQRNSIYDPLKLVKTPEE